MICGNLVRWEGFELAFFSVGLGGEEVGYWVYGGKRGIVFFFFF